MPCRFSARLTTCLTFLNSAVPFCSNITFSSCPSGPCSSTSLIVVFVLPCPFVNSQKKTSEGYRTGYFGALIFWIIFIILGIPVILSKITLSQIIADNKIGGTSVIFIYLFCSHLSFLRNLSPREQKSRFYHIHLQLNSPFSQVIYPGKIGKLAKLKKKNGRAFYTLPSFMWLFPLLLLAPASYARISLCLVCVIPKVGSIKLSQL